MKNFTHIIALFYCFASFAQNSITGTISDEIGPLSRANILLKHKNLGVVTDHDGRFEIQALPKDTLSISYLGYHTKDVSIGNRKSIDIFLEGSIKLDEIIICGCANTTIDCIEKCTHKIRTSCGIEVISLINIEDLGEFQSTLFPNPSIDGLFQLDVNDHYKTLELTIVSITGQIIKTINSRNINDKLNIDLSELPSGLYFINVIANGKRLETKRAIRN